MTTTASKTEDEVSGSQGVSEVVVTTEPAKRDLATVETELAAKINEEHRAFESALANATEHAYRAGELLIEAKAQLRHGEWLPWLKTNFEFTERWAQTFMRIASEFPNAKAASHFTIAGAVKQLAAPKTDDDKFLAQVDRLEAQIEGAAHAEKKLAELLRGRDEITFERIVKRSRLSQAKLKQLRGKAASA